MIDAAEMADIRADAESALPDVGNIVTIARSRDARGQVTETSVTGPDFACHLVPLDLATPEAEWALRLGVQAAWRVVMPLSILVTASDSIGVTVDGESALYEVIGGDQPESYAAYRLVVVSRLS